MARARITVVTGDIAVAADRYRQSPSPNLVLLETSLGKNELLTALDRFAATCELTTRLIVMGASNDIDLYRALMRRGVSEYLQTPVEPQLIVAAIAGLFCDPTATKLGRSYAFVGARGGVGSSTLAHNVAWTLGRLSGGTAILADMDLAFGTATLDFDLNDSAENSDGPGRLGAGEAMRAFERFDDQMLDRILVPCGEHLSVLPAPGLPETTCDLDPTVFEKVLDIAQARVSHVVLDMPHMWLQWTRQVLVAADEVVIVASPDLASLRNSRSLVDFLRRARPNDPEPRLVMNQVGMPKRPEIKTEQFAELLHLTPVVSLPFNPQTFGAAANSGRMLADTPRGASLADSMRQIAEALCGRSLSSQPRFPGMARLFGRFGGALRAR